MRLLIAAFFVLALSILGLASFGGGHSDEVMQGELRCEGAGAVIINVDGEDYAVNGKAGPGYPPIQRIWNSTTHPDVDLDLLITRGLTLCNW
jgi:hypothetical protein